MVEGTGEDIYTGKFGADLVELCAISIQMEVANKASDNIADEHANHEPLCLVSVLRHLSALEASL